MMTGNLLHAATRASDDKLDWQHDLLRRFWPRGGGVINALEKKAGSAQSHFECGLAHCGQRALQEGCEFEIIKTDQGNLIWDL